MGREFFENGPFLVTNWTVAPTSSGSEWPHAYNPTEPSVYLVHEDRGVVILRNVGKLTDTEKQVERQLWTTVKVEINKYSCKTRITNPAITHNFLRAIGYLKPIKDHKKPCTVC